MHKLGGTLIIIAAVAGCYLIMLVTMTVVVEMIESANTTMTASSNLTNYPGTPEYMISIPWQLWFVPACIGIIVIVIYNRGQ